MKLSDNGSGYGIPGLPGLYTGGPRTDSFSAPPIQGGGGLQLKMGDSSAPPAPAPAPFDPSTIDPKNMTPQQAADLMEYVSKLPPDVQQRVMAAAQIQPHSTGAWGIPGASGMQRRNPRQRLRLRAGKANLLLFRRRRPRHLSPHCSSRPEPRRLLPQLRRRKLLRPRRTSTLTLPLAPARCRYPMDNGPYNFPVSAPAGSSTAPLNSTNAAPALLRAPDTTNDVYPSAPPRRTGRICRIGRVRHQALVS